MFYKRLKAICGTRGITVTAAVRAVDGSIGSVDGWKKGCAPVSDIVIKLADYLNTSTDYLYGRVDDPAPLSKDMRTLDEQEYRIVDSLRAAHESMRIVVYNMVAAALSTPAPVDAACLSPVVSLSTNDAKSSHGRQGETFFEPGSVVEPDDPTFMTWMGGLLLEDAAARIAQKEREQNELYEKHVEDGAAEGLPITAVPEDDLTVSVPAKYRGSNHFVVWAQGDSMIGAGINDGDCCVFQVDAPQDDGRIMLVQIDGVTDQPDVTIKRLYRRGKQVELRSENPAHAPMFYPVDSVRVTGVLAAVLAVK